MRKVVFLALLLVAITGLASANDTVAFYQGAVIQGGTIDASGNGSNIELGALADTNNFGYPGIPFGTLLDFNNTSLQIYYPDPSPTVTIFSGTYMSGSNNVSCNAYACSATFSTIITGTFDPTFASLLGLSGNEWMLTGGSLAPYDSASGTYIADNTSVTFSPVATPEPASLVLLGLGAFGIFSRRKALK